MCQHWALGGLAHGRGEVRDAATDSVTPAQQALRRPRLGMHVPALGTLRPGTCQPCWRRPDYCLQPTCIGPLPALHATADIALRLEYARKAGGAGETNLAPAPRTTIPR
jgi:hypothetical protein